MNKMMKKTMKMMSVVFTASMLLTSCFSYTSVVGIGAQGTSQTTKLNHYVVYGLWIFNFETIQTERLTRFKSYFPDFLDRR